MSFLLAVIGAFVVALLIALAMNCLGLYSVRKMGVAHWTERARKLYPIRRSAGLNVWLMAGFCFAGAAILFPNNLNSGLFEATTIAAWIGAFLAIYPISKVVSPEFSFFGWLKYFLMIYVLRLGTIGTVLLAAFIMPDELGWLTIVLAVAVLAFLIALQYGLWLWMGSKLGLFQRTKDSDGVAKIVRQTSERMQVPYRSVWKLRAPIGYAAAMPMGRDLIFSDGLLATHPDEEVAAICAHELAHLSEPRNVHRARMMASLIFFPFIFIRPAVHSFGIFGLGLVYLPIAFLAIYMRKVGRKMEVRADAAASGNQDTTGVYARALERLYRNNQMPAVMSGKGKVHPHLYDRLLAAGVTPDYPRPKAPASCSWTSGLIILVLMLIFVAIFFVREIFNAPSQFGV